MIWFRFLRRWLAGAALIGVISAFFWLPEYVLPLIPENFGLIMADVFGSLLIALCVVLVPYVLGRLIIDGEGGYNYSDPPIDE